MTSSSHTHRTALARSISKKSGISYQKVLTTIVKASEMGLLPSTVTPAGRDATEVLILQMLTQQAEPAHLTFGRTLDDKPVHIPLTALYSHCLVSGQMGSGSSLAAAQLVSRLLSLGFTGTVVSHAGGVTSWFDELPGIAPTWVATPADPGVSLDPLSALVAPVVGTSDLVGFLSLMEDEYWINVCGSLLTTWKGLDDVKERNMSSLCEFLDKMSNDMSLTRDERRMASTWGPTLAHVSNLSSPSLSSWSQARDFPGVGLVELPSSFDTQSTALALRALTRAIAPWSSSAATPASQRRFVLIEEPQNLDAYAVDLILGNDLSI